jgi:hypothetical protein
MSVRTDKNKFSRKDAKALRNDYHVSVFLRAFASLREVFLLLLTKEKRSLADSQDKILHKVS